MEDGQSNPEGIKENLDPKITTLLRALKIRQVDVEETTGGIRIKFPEGSIPAATIDIYALRSNPDHLRAKIRGTDEFPEMSEADLKKVRIKLQNELLGMANVGAFASLGRRGEAHYYYAHITMSKKSSTDLTLVQKGAQQALEQLKGIDSGSFRKGLDQLGLPRSSKVRLALTRIFRESADIEEMLTVVVQEAGIIAKSDDWRVLKDIREKNEIPYLNIVVELLWKAVAKERLIKTLEDIHN
jgi:hypothetical protein